MTHFSVDRDQSFNTDIIFENISDNSVVSQRCVLVHGRSRSLGKKEGYVIVEFDGEKFPKQKFLLSNGFFRALIPLEIGDNAITFTTDVSGSYNQHKTLRLRYVPAENAPPIHFCLILAKDSPKSFDVIPHSQRVRYEGGNTLEIAVKKMRMAAYMTSAFTLEQMNRNKFGMRSFKPFSLVEQDTLSEQGSVDRETAHIHIICCDKTTAQIRDANIAQQNDKATDGDALFGIACTALRKYGGPFNNGFAQAACIFLDSHWDPNQKIILGHAALGGCDGDLRVAIFGSHALWSWPTSLESLSSACLDCTETDVSHVANDSNQSGTAWEALCISMGAFLHEIGHLLTCPHEPSGVMLRGYLFFTRSFIALEAYSSREKKVVCRSPQPKDEDYWHRLDLLRFLRHPSFLLPGETIREGPKPAVFISTTEIIVQDPRGIFMLDVHVDDMSRGHLEYNLIPVRCIKLDDIRRLVPAEFQGKPMSLHIHCAPMEEVIINDVEKRMQNSQPVPHMLTLGHEEGEFKEVALPLSKPPSLVRIHAGSGLDGIEFVYPDRQVILFGNRGGSAHDVPLTPEDGFLGISLRAGLWIDAAGVVTAGSRSPIWGGPGGGQTELVPPHGYRFAGLKGWFTDWCMGISMILEKEA